MNAPGRGEAQRHLARLFDAAVEHPESGEVPTTVEIASRFGIAEGQVRQMRKGDRPLSAHRMWQLPGAVFRPLLERLAAAHPDAVAEVANEQAEEAIVQAIATMGRAQAGLALVVLHASARDPAALAAQLSAVVRDVRRVLAHLERQPPANDTEPPRRSKSA